MFLSTLTWTLCCTFAAAVPAAPLATWTDLPNMAVTMREHQVIPLSSTQFMTLGGVFLNRTTTNRVMVYNVPAATWSTVASPGTPVNHPNARAVNGKVYLLGGFIDDPKGNGNWIATPYTGVYDPTSNKWTAMTPVTSALARGASALGIFNNTIYVAGGKAGTGAASVTTVTAFDTLTQTWTPLPSAAAKMPGARDHVGGAVVGSKFYVVGGRDTEISNYFGTVFILDLENLAAGWKTSTAKMPTPRGGLSATAVGTKIYTFGGEGNPASGSNGVFPNVEVYDTVTDSWSKEANMKFPRHGTQAVTMGDNVFIPGGGTRTGGGDTNHFDYYTI